MPAVRAPSGDLLSGALLAGLGVYIVVEAWPWEYLGPDGPGPGFFPRWYGLAMIVLALGLMAASARRASAPRDGATARGLRRALAAWVGLAVCVALLRVLGFAVAFALFTFFVIAVMYRRPWTQALVLAAAAALAFHLVFPVALGVNLPTGVLGALSWR